MGQCTKKSKLNVQKESLKRVFVKMLETNIEIMKFQATLTDKKEEKKGLLNLAKKSETAIEIVKEIEHVELLISLYNMYINKKEAYFISICGSICSKEMKKWDKTEKGFKEFLKLEQEAVSEYNQKQEESKKQAEMIQNAKKEGKKVEYIFKEGKLKPVIVEDKPN